MKKYLLRWPTWLLLAAIIVAVLIPGLSVFHVSKSSRAHAAGTNTSPIISFSASIVRPYQTVNVTGQGGFTPGETVNVHVQYHTKSIHSATVDASGASSVGFTLPTSYNQASNYFYVYAVSSTGTDKAKASFSFVPAGLQPDACCITYGSPITFIGQGFKPNEAIDLFWNYQHTGQLKVGSVKAASDGTFSITLSTPSDPNSFNVSPANKDAGNASVQATGGSSGISQAACAQCIQLTPNTAIPGATISVQGSNSVNFYWISRQIGERKAGTATTDSQGNFDTTLIIPSIPFNQQINLVAVGTISKVRASIPLTASAGLIDTPSSGNPGAKVRVNGGGFASGEIVTLTFEGNTIGTLITDKWGGFTTSYTIPSSTQLGAYLIEAVGSSSGVSVSTDFVVVPTVVITPTTGTSGTSITVKGSFFNASSTLTILWFDPNAYTDTLLGTVTTSASGGFKTVVTAPANLTSGDTYYVQIFDPSQNSVIAIEAFTAQ